VDVIVTGNEIMVELEIQAGEETAKTEAMVDLLMNDFDETIASFVELLDQILDTDVTMNSVEDADAIEAIAPFFYRQVRLPSCCPTIVFPFFNVQKVLLNVQLPSAIAAISRLVNETKKRLLNANSEILIPIKAHDANNLHVKLAAAEKEFKEKYTELGRHEDV
jgi:hypothetical protein